MAGNSSRKGAIRQSKKGPSAGTGGNNKRRLEGKGPTPKAEDRPYHAAAKRKKAAEKKETRSPRVTKGDRPRGEIVAGRNAVLEALRENVPSTELLVARSIDVDDRVAESLKLALTMVCRFVKHTVPKLKAFHLTAKESFLQLNLSSIQVLKKSWNVQSIHL
jgi:23S rRNA (guanosine2251-2'-O)-methyltransferase